LYRIFAPLGNCLASQRGGVSIFKSWATVNSLPADFAGLVYNLVGTKIV